MNLYIRKLLEIALFNEGREEVKMTVLHNIRHWFLLLSCFLLFGGAMVAIAYYLTYEGNANIIMYFLHAMVIFLCRLLSSIGGVTYGRRM